MSRSIAIDLVGQLLEQGYTIERAEHESCKGFAACDGSGLSYVIRQGVIQVPAFSGERFRFRILASEFPRQRNLF